ncbi:Lipopolysaccharide N-acetylglucosaminyltransferase [Roseomonas mucosa]|uniref:glycosyltransferase family 4 protein n=1 Tax=Roseomonas mucosa TaxID=207340 RepID=UPI0021F9E800|nr:glycosyltransferase family 1 protein [Roseomonas mucosa]QDJ07925.1 Lipopolysaccharide N-acetylglucosaminyltransferase [Roseomonas mucosa]
MSAAAPPSPVLWVEVGDLLDYAAIRHRLSGIQRLAFELCRALAPHPGVRFCRAVPPREGLRAVEWAELEALYARLSGGDDTPPPGRDGHAVVAEHVAAPVAEARRGMLRQAAGWLPSGIRIPLARATVAQASVASELRQALRGVAGALPRPLPRPGKGGSAKAPERAAVEPGPGDTLLIPGAPWAHPDYGPVLGRMKARSGLRIALVLYDLIAVKYPEWTDPGLMRVFGPWLRRTLPQVDHVLAISGATARDAAAWVAEQGIAPAPRITAFPIGTGFGAPRQAVPAVPPPRGDPGYVLFVSTIEARKNHALAFRVWRRLLEEMPEREVPRLVFAGGAGWLVQDLLGQIRNTANLGGKLVLAGSPSDSDLRLLYRDCRFTFFPSFYEGWGLPVTESLSFGRACLASDRASVPEAGGRFCAYLDPDNATGATAAARALIGNPEHLAALEADIRDGFRPVPWSDTAAAVLAALG